MDSDSDGLICIPDLQNSLSIDLKSINLLEMTEPELVLRIGLEIFDALGDNEFEMELKRVMNFMKFQLKSEIDFVSL